VSDDAPISLGMIVHRLAEVRREAIAALNEGRSDDEFIMEAKALIAIGEGEIERRGEGDSDG
jgi:hypothetical protein